MSDKQISRIKINGEGNIVVDNIDNSTVNINVTNIFSQETKNITKPILNIIVLVSTKQDFEAQNTSEYCVPLLRYGQKPENWEIFGQEKESISSLLSEFGKLSKLDLDVVFVNRWQLDKAQKANLRTNFCKKIILIADLPSLIFEENKNFIKIFDHENIGGFLSPICHHLEKHQADFYKEKYDLLEFVDEFWKNQFNREFMFIDLAIPNKQLLFRKLADIAFKHLKLKSNPTQNISSELIKEELNSQYFD